LELCGQRYVAVNNVEVDPSKRKQMRQEIQQMVMEIMKENGNAVFTSKLLERVNEVIKKNKEGMRRRGGHQISPDLASTAPATANAVVIEIVQDYEVDREALAIVEKQVLHMADNS
jgi:hypothetical protein